MKPPYSLFLLLFCVITHQAIASFSTSDWLEQVIAESDVNQLGYLYLELGLEEFPTRGVTYGVHGRHGDVDYYDRQLPDPSPQARDRFSSARQALLEKLESMEEEELSRAAQIDLHILKNRVELDLLRTRELKTQENPYTWSTSLAAGYSGLIMRDYAPLEQRLQSFGGRCKATAGYLREVRSLLSPAAVRPAAQAKKTALSQLKGLDREDGLFGKTLPELLEGSKLDDDRRAEISSNCAAARQSIRGFTKWYEQAVIPREDGEWRLGPELYDRQYALQMDYPLSPQELLAEAEKALEVKSARLAEIGRNIHDAYLAGEIAAGTTEAQAELAHTEVVENIFEKMSRDRPTIESLIPDSYAMADSIVSFVRQKDLMDLPPASKLRIEAVPPQLSGNAVAFIMTAPPLEPHLESVWYWDLELLKGSPDYLQEYNRAVLALVYIHEGVPGHFVQLEYSNRSQRLIPKVFRNGPMVEGWASYIETQLVSQGFTVYADHPLGHELQMMAGLKLELRAVTNAIMDIRLNRTDWSEDEALALMIERGYQLPGEAQGKLGRARMGAVQLSSYFAGKLAIDLILAEYRKIKGADFSYKAFNERLVSSGSPPFFAIRENMLR